MLETVQLSTGTNISKAAQQEAVTTAELSSWDGKSGVIPQRQVAMCLTYLPARVGDLAASLAN